MVADFKDKFSSMIPYIKQQLCESYRNDVKSNVQENLILNPSLYDILFSSENDMTPLGVPPKSLVCSNFIISLKKITGCHNNCIVCSSMKKIPLKVNHSIQSKMKDFDFSPILYSRPIFSQGSKLLKYPLVLFSTLVHFYFFPIFNFSPMSNQSSKPLKFSLVLFSTLVQYLTKVTNISIFL